MPRKPRDAVIVITGASSGIGRATALECARRAGPLEALAERMMVRQCDMMQLAPEQPDASTEGNVFVPAPGGRCERRVEAAGDQEGRNRAGAGGVAVVPAKATVKVAAPCQAGTADTRAVAACRRIGVDVCPTIVIRWDSMLEGGARAR
jgi:NAD(P)-dependent dehydrogenase (short-subunit alcohol dehydrogenase family)